MPKRLLAFMLVLAAAAAAVTVNVILLGTASASNDPVGKLAPQHGNLPAAPRWTLRPQHGHVHDQGEDD
jgi:hypothetical protein